MISDSDFYESVCIVDGTVVFVRNVLLVFMSWLRNNLVDKIIYMLEEHSLNLEKLVEKRTEQWIEEKKRTEELLHSMLPK